MTQAADLNQQALSYIRHQATKGLAELEALMERTAADCARCLEGVSEEQAAFQPPSGTGPAGEDEWSIKEVLAHLLASTAGVNREVAGLAAGAASSRQARTGVAPEAGRSLDEMRRALADVWLETGRLVGSLPAAAPAEATWEHPFFGPLNYREWIAFQRLHAMDHVQQIEKVKAAPGYPKE